MSLAVPQFSRVSHRRFSATASHCPVALALVSALLAAPSVLAGEVQRSEEMRAHAGYFREHCIELQAGKSLAFSFTTPHPVDFNIHHHTDTETTYSVRQAVERELVLTLPIGDSGEYCFMWKNPADYPAAYPIELRYQVR